MPGGLSAWPALILWFSSVNKAARLMEHVRFLQDLGAGPLLWLDSCQPLRAQRASDSSMCCWRLWNSRAERLVSSDVSEFWIYIKETYQVDIWHGKSGCSMLSVCVLVSCWNRGMHGCPGKSVQEESNNRLIIFHELHFLLLLYSTH